MHSTSVARAAKPVSLFAKIPMLPGMVVGKMLAVARKVAETIGSIFWSKTPYKPTAAEKAILTNIDRIYKSGALQQTPLRRRLALASPCPSSASTAQVPTPELARDALSMLRGMITGEKELQAFDAVQPLILGLVGIAAQKQATIMNNIEFAPNVAPPQVSEPVKDLCHIANQIAQVAYQKAEESIENPQGKVLLESASPLIPKVIDVIAKKLGEVVHHLPIASLFDEVLASLMIDLQHILDVNKACVEEKKKLKEHQAMQVKKPHDPLVQAYLEKLRKAEKMYERLTQEDRIRHEESHLAIVKKEHPALDLAKQLEMARTEMLIDLYMEDFGTTQFMASSHCSPGVKRLFQQREQLDAEGVQTQFHNHVVVLAEELVQRLFPILENELQRFVLPTIMEKYLSEQEAQLVHRQVSDAIQNLWKIYRVNIIQVTTDLLEFVSSPRYWDEVLALEIMPLIQDKLLRQQLRLTVESDPKLFNPLLQQYAFAEESKRSAVVEELKEKLRPRVSPIPLEEARFHKATEALLLQLQDEQALLAEKLLPCLDTKRGDYLMGKIRKYVASNTSVADREKMKLKILANWQDLMLTKLTAKELKNPALIQKKIDQQPTAAFIRYAAPLLEKIEKRWKLQKKETDPAPKGLTDLELVKEILKGKPADVDARWGDLTCNYIFQIAPRLKTLLGMVGWDNILRQKISESFTDVVDIYRKSPEHSLEALVDFAVSRLGNDDGSGLDQGKIKKLLFDSYTPTPNVHQRLSQEIEKVAQLTHRLLVNQLSPNIAPLPGWLPGRKMIARKGAALLTGQDPSYIQQCVQDLVRTVFENPYIMMDRLNRVVAATKPHLDRAIDSLKAAAAAPLPTQMGNPIAPQPMAFALQPLPIAVGVA